MFLRGNESDVALQSEVSFMGAASSSSYGRLAGLNDLTIQQRTIKDYNKQDVWGNLNKEVHSLVTYSGSMRLLMRHSSAWKFLIDSVIPAFENQGGFMEHRPSRDPANRVSNKLLVTRNPGGEDWLFNGVIINRISMVWRATEIPMLTVDFVAGSREVNPGGITIVEGTNPLHTNDVLVLEIDAVDYSTPFSELVWTFSHPVQLSDFDSSGVPTSFGMGGYDYGGSVAFHADDDSTLAGLVNDSSQFLMHIGSAVSTVSFDIYHRAQFNPNPIPSAGAEEILIRRANFIGIIDPLNVTAGTGNNELILNITPPTG